MSVPPNYRPLSRYFAGVTEHAFLTAIGMTDTAVVDYVSTLLERFLHVDEIYRLHGSDGQPLTEVVDMVLQAEGIPAEGRTRREVHRHIGDFTLFWTGLFPETLEQKRAKAHKDAFVDYMKQGKRSYFIASTFEEEPYAEESRVLRRLSAEFELCAYGLNQVRKEFQAVALGG